MYLIYILDKIHQLLNESKKSIFFINKTGGSTFLMFEFNTFLVFEFFINLSTNKLYFLSKRGA